MAIDRGLILETLVAQRESVRTLATNIHKHSILGAMSLLGGDSDKILELAMVKATPSQCNLICSASPFSRGPKIQNSSNEKLVQDRMKNKRTVARRRR